MSVNPICNVFGPFDISKMKGPVDMENMIGPIGSGCNYTAHFGVICYACNNEDPKKHTDPKHCIFCRGNMSFKVANRIKKN